MEKQVLKKVGTGYGGIVYSDGKNEILVRSVNRSFENAKGKRPTMYIERKKDNKFAYFSGLFPTKNEYVFTADTKNMIGLKTLYKVSFIGDSLTIEQIPSMKGV